MVFLSPFIVFTRNNFKMALIGEDAAIARATENAAGDAELQNPESP